MIPETTIIMPVKNRLELTRQTIDTMQRTTAHIKNRLKVIIMADNVDEVMKRYLDSTGLTVHYCNFGQYHEPQSGLTVGEDVLRAVALSTVETPYIYFTDNDIYFKEGWLETLFDIYLSDPRMGIVGGRTHAMHHLYEITPKYRRTAQQAGYSHLMSKKIWNECGPYRKRFDDVGLNQSVTAHGYIIAQPVEPVIYHCGLTRSDGVQVIGYETESAQDFPEDCLHF